MGKCIHHPDRDTRYLCMKHDIYLCEECLQCKDPKIYCKFRPSCPIWFMSKRKEGLETDEKMKKADTENEHTVNFMPEGKSVRVSDGTTLLDAALSVGVHLNASCGGKGLCGKCKLIVEAGQIERRPEEVLLLTEKEKKDNYVLACMSGVAGDVTVRIPEETLEKKLKVAGMGKELTEKLKGLVTTIQPILMEIPLELEPPSLDDSVSDLDRLNRGLKKEGLDIARLNIGIGVIRELAAVMRDENWKITASVIQKKCSSEILRVTPGTEKFRSMGLAIDVGTTSIVVYLVDMSDGSILAATSGHNLQAACGDDVINRIICSEKGGVAKLSRMVLMTINTLISEALDSVDADFHRIKNVVISGNTTMTHLLLKIEPNYIRREPYIPSVSEFPILKAGEIGIKADSIAAVFIMPGPASYVGGDIVSGLVYTGLHREDPLTLFIDVGTNGEIVLGNRDWLLTASCSAGPAFEGGGIRWGMRAEEGAIEKVSIDSETLAARFMTVGNVSPRGICGSGMIDLIAEMLFAGIIDAGGKIRLDASHPRIQKEGDSLSYVLVPAAETAMEKDILFSETDIHSLILSKAAVYAGFTVLLNQAGLDFSMVDRVWIAGGFGQYLNVDRAIMIGLLPDIPRDKFQYMGNTSAAGAYLSLLSEDHRNEAHDICNSMTYIDFSTNNRFMDEFVSARFLPHTDINSFPSVKKVMSSGKATNPK
ncbi:MAG: ASKHA domain-containing protein [Pseudomonadota bacterium]